MPTQEEIDWNACLPWDGEEASLPLGEQTRIPNFRAIDLVRRWEVLDAESDAGFKVVTKSELKPSDIIIGAQINENSVNAVVKTYGKRFFVAYHSNPKPGQDKPMDRWEWYEHSKNASGFGQDVLELEALKQIRQRR
jgi:hypothetical protein